MHFARLFFQENWNYDIDCLFNSEEFPPSKLQLTSKLSRSRGVHGVAFCACSCGWRCFLSLELGFISFSAGSKRRNCVRWCLLRLRLPGRKEGTSGYIRKRSER